MLKINFSQSIIFLQLAIFEVSFDEFQWNESFFYDLKDFSKNILNKINREWFALLKGIINFLIELKLI